LASAGLEQASDVVRIGGQTGCSDADRQNDRGGDILKNNILKKLVAHITLSPNNQNVADMALVTTDAMPSITEDHLKSIITLSPSRGEGKIQNLIGCNNNLLSKIPDDCPIGGAIPLKVAEF
jgi:hypothetical protein